MTRLLKFLPLLMQVASAFDSVASGGEIIEIRPTIKGIKLRVQIARVPVSGN